jgi:uncharacterized membrane protein (Fun14 family)
VSDQIPTLDLEDGDAVALAVGAGGLLGLVVGFVVDSRMLRVLGLASLLVGGGLLVRGKLAVRSEKIDAAESTIRSELDDLDPVARAQVLAHIAQSEL